MTRAERIIRVVSSAAAATVAVLFVVGFNGIKYHNHVEHQHLALPEATAFVALAAPWAVLVPLAILASGMAWLKQDWAVVLITRAGWLFSLAWPLACIWAWELPHILL